MFKEFFIKKMLQSKGVPKEQIESLMVLIKKNPALFQQIAEEIQEKMKTENKDEMTVAMEVMQKHQAELAKLVR